MRVLITDPLKGPWQEILRAEGLEADYRPDLAAGDLAKAVAEADALVVRSRTKVTADVIAAAPRLRVIGRAGTGVDNVDVEAATRAGIVVMNSPHANAVSTAELTLAMLLALARHVPAADRSLREGRWTPGSFLGTELRGKRLGVLGLGKIGREVAARARAFGMEVDGYDPILSPEAAARMGVTLLPFDEVLARADFLTVHTPLTPETRHLIGDAALARAPKGVRIVNCARGGIVDEPALLRALESGHVAAAALDVFETEPPPPSGLLRHPRVVLTPHLGASTVEAQEESARDILRQVAAALRLGVVQNAVNMTAVEPELLRKLGPFLTLAERLGRLAGQMTAGPVRGIAVTYQGDIADLPTRPLTVALLKGLLAQLLDSPVNEVNALPFARERDIQVEEAHAAQHEDFASLITVTISGGARPLRLQGTLFGKKEPRLVGLDGFRPDAVLAGELLVFQNRDTPGVVGRVGTLLGGRGMNIATVSLGRDQEAGQALAVFALDAPATPDLVSEVERLPGMNWVRRVRLPCP